MLVHYERPEGEERDIEHLIENSSDSDDSANNTEFDDKPMSLSSSMAQPEWFD